MNLVRVGVGVRVVRVVRVIKVRMQVVRRLPIQEHILHSLRRLHHPPQHGIPPYGVLFQYMPQSNSKVRVRSYVLRFTGYGLRIRVQKQDIRNIGIRLQN